MQNKLTAYQAQKENKARFDAICDALGDSENRLIAVALAHGSRTDNWFAAATALSTELNYLPAAQAANTVKHVAAQIGA